MKKIGIISSLILFATIPNLMAQPSDKYGGDKEACGKNYTIYYELYKNKNYIEAIPFWQKTIEICPKFSANVWKNGERMYTDKIKNADKPDEKIVLIDSLMWIFDQRMLHFGDDPRSGTGFILGKKGIALAKHQGNEPSKAYNTLKESIKLQALNSKPDVILTFMKISRELYADGVLSAENILKDYEMVMEIAEYNLEKDANNKLFTMAKEGIESHFSKSGAADCDALASIYSKQFQLQKSDEDWVNKVLRQLKGTGCSDSEFYMTMLLAQFELEPSSDKAHFIARKYMKEEDFENAKNFLNQALVLNPDDEAKANINYELAYIIFSNDKDYQLARDYAKEATAIRPTWGDPYLLLGRIYTDARSKAFTEEFDQLTVLWAAIDQFAKAKTVDPSVSDKADDLIKAYSALFPTSETLFYYGLKDGDAYKVKGWIQEQTKVRAR